MRPERRSKDKRSKRGGSLPTLLYRHTRRRRSARVRLAAREWYCRAISGIIIQRPSLPIRSDVGKPRLPCNLLGATAVWLFCSRACWIWPRKFVIRSSLARPHIPVLDNDTTAPGSAIDSAGDGLFFRGVEAENFAEFPECPETRFGELSALIAVDVVDKGRYQQA